MFVTLPKVFDSMPGGDIIGAVFFVLVLLAALTSSISLMETIVSILQDKLKWSRTVTCIAVFVWCVVVGAVVSLGFGLLSDIKPLGMDDLLTFFDFVSNSVLMPILALLTCILIGFVIKPKTIIEEAEENGQTFKSKKLFTVMIKYVAPIFILLILISSILDGFGIIKI
jgi:NSS family neurotransmitter:Na+ symporter